MPWRRDKLPTPIFLGSSYGSIQLVKNPPAMQETWVPSLGWEDPLEKGKATHSSILVNRYTCGLENSMNLGAWQTIVNSESEIHSVVTYSL